MSGIQGGDITTDPTYYGPFHVKDVRLTSDKKKWTDSFKDTNY